MLISKIIKKTSQRYKAFKKHPLTKKDPLMALARYVWFNICQLIYQKPRIYNWIQPLKFYAEKGDAGIVANIYFKLHDYEDSMFLLDHIKENDLFIDVGANVGHFSLLAGGINKARVIAIEPIQATFNKLTKNIELNNLSSRVTCLLNGVGEKKGNLCFINDRTVMNRIAMENEKNTVNVNVITLNDLLKDKDPVFIKIDVEGFELPVLKGAEEVLKNKSLKYLMIEFNNSGKKYGFSDEDVFKFISKYDFIPISYDVKNNLIIKENSYSKHKFNTIFIRNNIV